MNRRKFIKTNLTVASGFVLSGAYFSPVQTNFPIRLGAPVNGDFKDPADWVKAHKALGYSAAYCPVQPGADDNLIKAYRAEAQKNNLLIAEAGVWNNLMDPDDAKRKQNLQKNIDCLRLADRIGAHCCVNISGARGEIWDIKSIHAKDIRIMPELTVHLEERRPGLGELDYVTFLQEASKLKDLPFMLEHLKTQDDYRLAAEQVRQTGKKAGIAFV